MELSRTEVPLYGRVQLSITLHTVLQEGELPEEAEVYVVLEGSTLDHIIRASRGSRKQMLSFVVPGHNIFETVVVKAYRFLDGHPVSCLATAFLEYVQDDAQELAEFLITHSHCLSTSSHVDIITRFGLGDDATNAKMDLNITQAMANLDYPYTWNVLGSQPGEELQPRESLLHVSVRLGLLHLSQLLLCQPGGLMAVALPNEEGETPLQLAERTGRKSVLELLNNPPNPLVSPLAGMSQMWVDSWRLLRFCHHTETLSLSVQRSSASSQQSSVVLLRKHLRDDNFLRELRALSQNTPVDGNQKEDLTTDVYKVAHLLKDISAGDQTLEDNVFEEQLVLSLEEEEEPAPLCSGFPAQATLSAAARLSAMLNGKDQIYANSMLVDQLDETDIKYRLAGVTGDSSVTESRGWDSALGSPCAGPARTEEKWTGEQLAPNPPTTSLLSQTSQPYRAVQNSQRETCTLSPNLVALELDSEEDDLLDKRPLSLPSTSPGSGGVLQTSSGDERDSFEALSDLFGNRTLSASFNCPLVKDLAEPEVRLRSYSYSSPKISLVRPRFNRDAAISDLSEDGVFSSSGRSLLQALSLSKSLSLLNPVKQRALSLPEQPQEKRELGFRKRAQSAEDEGSVALADSLQHLTLSEFLKEIEEEEWDKYIIPSKAESEKYKVSRTFSFLKSRMSSTRSKSKGKGKEKEGKEKATNGHLFAPAGSGSGLTLCLVCDKPAMGKDLLQCSSCTINIHKGCRDAATPCVKKAQDRYAVTVKNKTASLPSGVIVREAAAPCPIPTSTSLPVIARDKREQPGTPNALSKSVPTVTERRLSEGLEGDGENSSCRNRSQSEELLPVTESSPSTDSSLIEDAVDGPLRNDFRADMLDYEAESWSLAVDHKFCKKHDKRTVKRQDVIYELMQTEMHHIQTLTIMADIFRKGMKEELQLDLEMVDKIFPCLDELFDFHKGFFCAMKERRQASTQEDNERNFLIERIGDILVQQFCNENAEKMKQVYGEFCSHHTEAVNLFKELQQQNKKFQAFIKQQSNNYLVRRKEIPECILLVTQRITKYPVLLERILQYSQEATEEHSDLSRALVLIREVIAAVDLKVSEYEKEQKLLDVLNRMENKSSAKLKNGHTFRKQDLLSQGRMLKHEGLVYWKTATGRLKDVQALLLTDILIFLQEKDQKFIFAAVDQKPPVISLQKLIVREVANEERGMFLISASAAGPEMYEVHTISKEERNAWMRLIREAVERNSVDNLGLHSCPEEEEEISSESEEDKRAAEARAHKIQKLQETLASQDQQICSNLEEKLRLYSELTRLSVSEDTTPEPRLLVQPNSDEVPQAAVLLSAALKEAENLTATLMSHCGPSPTDSSPSRLHSSSGYVSIQEESDYQNCSVTQLCDGETSESEWIGTDVSLLQTFTDLKTEDSSSLNMKVAQGVQSLTQLLYSLQAAVTIQDSCFEVQKLLLQESDRQQPRPPCLRGNALLEQEKQRNLEKQREELAGTLKLQAQLRQERQRWERERELRQRQQGALESRLEQREQECRRQGERLQRERSELEAQLRDYQQSLERLREGQRLVSRQRERLEAQQRLLQSWRHSRQRSLPVMVIPLNSSQDSSPSQYGGFDHNGSLFVNEVALQTPLNNRHAQQHQRSGSLVYSEPSSSHNSLNSIMVRPRAKQGPHRADTNSDLNAHSFSSEKWPAAAALFPDLLHPADEEESGEDGGEENIVYL